MPLTPQPNPPSLLTEILAGDFLPGAPLDAMTSIAILNATMWTDGDADVADVVVQANVVVEEDVHTVVHVVEVDDNDGNSTETSDGGPLVFPSPPVFDSTFTDVEEDDDEPVVYWWMEEPR